MKKKPEQKLDLTSAADFLKVSRRKMWSLAKAGTIRYTNDPLDGRRKLFKVADLEKLKEASA